MPTVEILKPTPALAPKYLEFIEEMRSSGEKVWESMVPMADESPERFVDRINAQESELGPSLVPQTTYWGVSAGKVVGRIVLRHRLNEKLREIGGHVSYEVRPSCRRCGFAKEMLRRILDTAKAQEMGRLLLTCAPSNEASNKTITANGGILTKTAYVEEWKRDTNYYWIELRETP